jgi:outer membrane immunogenic protein
MAVFKPMRHSSTCPGTFSMKGTRTGWTVGSGVEALLGGAWTAKIEYLYVDLGTQSANFTAGGSITLSVPRSVNIFFARA